ncbi:hypothetical protein [Massilia sp. IC2-476]|uniref:hypothetical protein n=1 Tax=Massilia sp. IC2-476 TaxID=2887199 RepID=UPI001D0FC39E|nr:hypothetical protein [Massilia sp. IC2-476]MCC2971071.1 hypothetical protein [Massilia sp. IC2-476]
MKKEETVITLKNGGMHSQTNYRKCKEMILHNNYDMPRLYHLVFTGSQHEPDYLYIVNALAKKLRDNKVPCKWKACFEMDEAKGLHMHVMLLLDANQGGRPDNWIRYAENGWLVLLLKERGMGFNISQPQNKIHRTKLGKKQNYAYITKSGPKLEDALIWCSYLYKKRSKDDSMKTIYHSSRERVSKSSLPIAALPAAMELVTTQTETKEQNEEQFATSHEAGSGSQSIAASKSTDANRSTASSTAMVGTGCENLDASTNCTSTKAEDQRRRGNGGTNTHHEEVNLAGLIGRFPFRSYRFPMRKGVETRELVNPAVGVYNCLTDVRQSYTTRLTI